MGTQCAPAWCSPARCRTARRPDGTSRRRVLSAAGPRGSRCCGAADRLARISITARAARCSRTVRRSGAVRRHRTVRPLLSVLRSSGRGPGSDAAAAGPCPAPDERSARTPVPAGAPAARQCPAAPARTSAAAGAPAAAGPAAPWRCPAVSRGTGAIGPRSPRERSASGSPRCPGTRPCRSSTRACPCGVGWVCWADIQGSPHPGLLVQRGHAAGHRVQQRARELP